MHHTPSQPRAGARKRKAFFFEKKKQKTFDYWRAPRRQRGQMTKSFLVLFFKKEQFLALPELFHVKQTENGQPIKSP
jgi:hypothetical protein